MDRYSVVQTIRQTGYDFRRVMSCLQSADYVAGYEQALRDMIQTFEYKPAIEGIPKKRKFVLFGGTRGRKYEGF